MIFEDNESFPQALKDVLKRHFPCLTLKEACGGRDAREKLGQCDAELAFVDIKLPDDNGLQLTQDFKRRCPPSICCHPDELRLP